MLGQTRLGWIQCCRWLENTLKCNRWGISLHFRHYVVQILQVIINSALFPSNIFPYCWADCMRHPFGLHSIPSRLLFRRRKGSQKWPLHNRTLMSDGPEISISFDSTLTKSVCPDRTSRIYVQCRCT